MSFNKEENKSREEWATRRNDNQNNGQTVGTYHSLLIEKVNMELKLWKVMGQGCLEGTGGMLKQYLIWDENKDTE